MCEDDRAAMLVLEPSRREAGAQSALDTAGDTGRPRHRREDHEQDPPTRIAGLGIAVVLLSSLGVATASQASADAPASAVANLRPAAITMDQPSPVVGRKVNFDSGVQNDGGTGTRGFNVRWLVDGTDVGAYGGHAGVPAGHTVMNGNSQFSWTFATAGTHTVTFVVDTDNHVPESNEGDNSIVINAGVAPAPANLRPAAITMDQPSPVVGRKVNFDSGVQNDGGTGTRGFNVRWLVDGTDVGAYGGHAGVPAGHTVMNGNSQFSWTFPRPPGHTR